MTQPGPWDTPAAPPPMPEPAHRAFSPVALGLLAAFVIGLVFLSLTETPSRMIVFAVVTCGWILAVSAHEFGHAFVAWRGGDVTVAQKGYLTFDPLKYADPVTSIVLPLVFVALGGIGFPGGAVYLRQDLMRSPAWRAAASLAGPAGTLVVFVVLAIGLAVARTFAPNWGGTAAIAFLAYLQATAFVLNLLPIPGLDGYGALRPLLPAAVRQAIAPIEGFGVLAFMALFLFWPPLGRLVFGVGGAICALGGVPGEEIIRGLREFQFWK